MSRDEIQPISIKIIARSTHKKRHVEVARYPTSFLLNHMQHTHNSEEDIHVFSFSENFYFYDWNRGEHAGQHLFRII